MSQLVRNTEELGARSRENRRYSQGKVAAVDTYLHTAKVDVGAYLPDGTVQYLHGVPFDPQNPPAVGAMVGLDYFGTSPHGVRIVSAGVGGQNTQSSVSINAGNVVNSLKKTGESVGQVGDLELEAVAPLILTRTGRKFSFSGGTVEPTHRGQILYCEDGSNWVAAIPLVSDTGEILTEDDTGYLIVMG